MRGSAALFRIAVEFSSKRQLCLPYWRRKPLISCRSIMRPAGLPFADYWNFIAPLWVSADTGGVQFIENFRLRHLGWEFP
jgi:hypothetical protein